MDILDLYSRLKNSYKEYISSFVRIKDKRIEDVVTKAIHREKMWPKALIQFNPNYAKGIGIAKMIENGLPIHKDLEKFFNTPFYKHQQEAIELGCRGKEFIVTSGTGSGKSRTFMATVFNHILQHQDDCVNKPNSLVADFNLLPEALEEALNRRQIQPLFKVC